MAMRIGDSNELLSSSAGAICSSPHYCRLQMTHQRCSTPQKRGDYARLGLVRMLSRWSATIFIPRISLREDRIFFENFDFFDFLILNPMAGPLLLSAHLYGILIPFVAHHGRYEAPKLAQIWILDVVAATSLSPGFGPTEKEAWHLYRDVSVAVAVEWVGTGWDAGNGLSDWSDRYAGWMDGWMDGCCIRQGIIARGVMEATRTLPCLRGRQCYGPRAPRARARARAQPSAHIQQGQTSIAFLLIVVFYSYQDLTTIECTRPSP